MDIFFMGSAPLCAPPGNLNLKSLILVGLTRKVNGFKSLPLNCWDITQVI